MKFYYIYKTLAHPEHNGYVEPITLEERLMHVKEAQRTLRTGIAWICDTMSNDLKHALGNAPNSEFVIDPDGKVVRKRIWSDPEALREDLVELVGPVENPTNPDDLDMEPPQDHRPASGVLERVLPALSTRPLKTETVLSSNDLPYYVKLRAEADDPLMESGTGQMYLGFDLDPIYHVHWNNLAPPIEFDLILPKGVTATPASGTGPKLKVQADIDPREFLIDVHGFQGEPIGVKVRYVACDDAETFCVPAEHEFKIYPQFDSDAGMVFARLRPDFGDDEDEETGEGIAKDDARRTSDMLEMTGHFDGHLRGRIDAVLTGHFQGRIFGRSDQPTGVEMRGEFDGKLDGRVRGRIDGQFEGQVDGRIGGGMGGRPGGPRGRITGRPRGRFGGHPGGRFGGGRHGRYGRPPGGHPR